MTNLMSSQNSISHMATLEGSAVGRSKEGSKEGRDCDRVDSCREGIVRM